MGKVLPEIGEAEAAFIESQKIFFVATAPTNPHHRVNVSPKGGTVTILDKKTVMYADLTGSGSETAAHIMDTPRLTILFCNIQEGPPKILRLFGVPELILAENVPDHLLHKLPQDIVQNPGFRAVYMLRVNRISSSCGYSLPIFDFTKSRHTLHQWSTKKGPDGMFDYVTEKNSFSIDGLKSIGVMRKKAPLVVAVPTDGYIYGKAVSLNHPQKGAVPRYDEVPLRSTKTETSSRWMVLGGAALFTCGLLTGAAAVTFLTTTTTTRRS